MSNKDIQQMMEDGELPDPDDDRDYSQERDDRCEPLAAKILQILAEHKPDPTIGRKPKNKEEKKEEREKIYEEYTPIAEEVLQLMLEKNIQLQDINYVFKILHGFVDHLKQMVQTSKRNAVLRAEHKLWGKDTDFLTLQDIEDIINPEDEED